MARVLLAWEIGDGLGHITRLLPIARRLKQEGVACTLAVRDLGTLLQLDASDEFPALQAPVVTPAEWAGRARVSGFSDILGIAGFDDPARLRPAILGWDNLLDLVRPDLVLADFSPVLCLAMSGGPRPLLVLGDGFTLPPAEAPTLPRFRDIDPVCSEDEALAVANTVLAERGRPALPALPALFGLGRHYVVTVPELDPHAGLRGPAALGPIEPLPRPATTPPVRAWFAYLSAAHPLTRVMLEALAGSGGEGAVFLRDASGEDRDSARALGLTVHDKPPNLAEAVAASEVVIHHGGLGTAQTCLAVGRVQMLVPRQLEQRLNAACLGELGVAVGMGPRFAVSDAVAALARARSDERLREAAQRHAALIAARGPATGLERLVRDALRTMASGPGRLRVAPGAVPGYRR